MKKTFNIQYFERIRKNHIHALQPAYRKYILFPNDNAVTSCLINGSIYEPYYFDFISDNLISLDGMEIIDIGANNGHFTVEFAQYVGDTGKVRSFEPQRIIFQQLCGNVFLNGLDNVYTYNVALGDKVGITNVEKPNYFDSGYVNFGDVHILESTDENVEKVEIKTVDSYEFENVGLIKIDAQGFESYILSGATNTINKYRPYIFIEIEDDQLKKYGFSEQSLIDQIEKMGYIVRRFHIGVSYQTVSSVCLDCVCIPIEKYETNNYIIR
jgi:FkbM family methyltransferase